MPLARLGGRLVREQKRSEDEERRRRHELWVAFVGRFFSVRGEADPPITREEYLERKAVQNGKRRPPEPSFAEWQQQELARKSWERLRDSYLKAAQSAYHFEEMAGYGDHLFPEPEETATTVMTAQDIKEWERSAESAFIAGLTEQVKRQPQGRV